MTNDDTRELPVVGALPRRPAREITDPGTPIHDALVAEYGARIDTDLETCRDHD